LADDLGPKDHYLAPHFRTVRQKPSFSEPFQRRQNPKCGSWVKSDIQLIRDALTSHVAKEDVLYEIFKRVMNTGVSITGALIALLLAIIGYLLVHPVGLS
jgi:hypothetical protein